MKPRTSDEQALEVRSGRACAWMSVQQEQSAFLRILSGTVRKQASMARGMRLHNARCAMQQQEMAKGSYNEVVLSAETWVDNMPNTVLAVFYLRRARAEQIAHARQVHANFLKRYRLPSSQVPLIEYDEAADARSAAFRLAPAR